MTHENERKALQLMSEFKQYCQHANGTENYYRHPLFRQFLYTDGVRHVAKTYEAYWLLDKIIADLLDNNLINDRMVVATLIVDVINNTGQLTYTNGDYELLRSESVIEFTDFPMHRVDIWILNKTLFLPCEN